MSFNRTKAMVAGSEDSIGLIVNLGGRAAVTQRDHDFSLGKGEAYPILTGEPASLSGRRHLGMLLPRPALASRIKHIEDFRGRIDGNSLPLRLLLNYLNGLPEKLGPVSHKLRRVMINHIYDLAALAINPDRPVNENGLSATAAARLELALTYINRNFVFPGLTISATARSQNVSPRYLQRLIETTGMTFSERVTELRLQLAFAQLTDRRFSQKRVSDIALQSGFSDISNFNRSFRRRFGDTPGNVRAGASTSDLI